jgi:hypothetical protein
LSCQASRPIIQQAANELWDRCRKEPELVGEVERLCWLDIGLIQARSDVVGAEVCPERREDLM